MEITGVTAQDSEWDGQSHRGYKGTPAAEDYNEGFTFTYTGRDGTVYDSTEAPTNVGDYTVTIAVPEEIRDYRGSTSLDFRIVRSDLSTAIMTLDRTGFSYDGTEHRPGVTVVKSGRTLTENTDYTVTYENNVDAGTASVTVTAVENGNYCGSSDKETFVIEPKALTDAMLSLSPNAFTYDGREKTPGIIVTDGEKVLAEGTDYAITGDSETSKTDVGTYTITAQGMGNYTGTAAQTWKVQKTDMTSVTAADLRVIYDRTVHSITVNGAPAGAEIAYSTDGKTWSAANPSFTAAGTYTVYYRVQQANYNDFSGSAVVEIEKRPVTVSGITAESKTYDRTKEATLNYERVTFSGLAEGDSLTVTATGVFEDANAGTGKKVSVSGLVLGGADAANYILADSGQQTDAAADITPKKLTITITPNGGVYGAVTGAKAQPEGVVDGDTVEVFLTYTGTAEDKTTTYNGAEIPSAVGTYTVTAGIRDGNYSLTGSVTALFVVAKADAEVPVSPEQPDKLQGNETVNPVPDHKDDESVTYPGSNETADTVENGSQDLRHHPAADSSVDTDTDGGAVSGKGSIGVEVPPAENAPETTLVTSKEAIIEMLVQSGGLTAEELAQVAEDAELNVILKVTDATETITEQSKAQIEKAASGYTIGQYIDISLYKQIIRDGEAGELVQITGTYDTVTIVVKVPENLLNTDSSITRTFCIVRNHDGEVEFLPTDYDAAEATLTFETDRFSDYAIVYQDTARTTDGGSDTIGVGDDDSTPMNTADETAPQTGDSMKLWLWLLLLVLLCGGVTGILIYRKKRS